MVKVLDTTHLRQGTFAIELFINKSSVVFEMFRFSMSHNVTFRLGGIEDSKFAVELRGCCYALLSLLCDDSDLHVFPLQLFRPRGFNLILPNAFSKDESFFITQQSFLCLNSLSLNL